VAIKPHCVVCGFDSDAAGGVEFADYSPGWREPMASDGSPIIGWSNELGVTAPPGVGLFCERHLRPARRLRRLPAKEAVRRLSAPETGGGLWSRLRARL
jgi:hypothetical protein